VLLLMCGCPNQPNTYAPHARREPIEIPERELRPYVAMGAFDTSTHILYGISYEIHEQSWRWAADDAALRLRMPAASGVRFVMHFTIPEATFQHTGPVTSSVFVEGREIGSIRCDAPASYYFDKPVPDGVVPAGTRAEVRIRSDKAWVDPVNNARLSLQMAEAGFVR